MKEIGFNIFGLRIRLRFSLAGFAVVGSQAGGYAMNPLFEISRYKTLYGFNAWSATFFWINLNVWYGDLPCVSIVDKIIENYKGFIIEGDLESPGAIKLREGLEQLFGKDSKTIREFDSMIKIQQEYEEELKNNEHNKHNKDFSD